jgi:hypothetical protein
VARRLSVSADDSLHAWPAGRSFCELKLQDFSERLRQVQAGEDVDSATRGWMAENCDVCPGCQVRGAHAAWPGSADFNSARASPLSFTHHGRARLAVAGLTFWQAIVYKDAGCQSITCTCDARFVHGQHRHLAQ